MPDERLKDKKGLGVVGTSYEPLGPKLAAKAAELGYKKRGKLGRNPDDPESESDSDSEDADSEDEDSNTDLMAKGAAFISLRGKVSTSIPVQNTESDNAGVEATNTKTDLDNLMEGIKQKVEKTTITPVEENPYFFVDTEPVPVDLSVPAKEGKGAKKRRLAEERAEKRAAKKVARESRATHTEDPAISATAPEADASTELEKQPDFAAIEAQLRADIEAKTKEQEAEKALKKETTEEIASRKKRRRSSDGTTEIAQRKIKKDKKVQDKKRKAEESAASEVSLEVSVKKNKEDKHDKKRKAKEGAVVSEPEEVVVKKYKPEKNEKKRKVESDDKEVPEKKKRKQKVVEAEEEEEEEL